MFSLRRAISIGERMDQQMPSASEKRNPVVAIGITTGLAALVLSALFARTHEQLATWPQIFAATLASCLEGDHPSISQNFARMAREVAAFVMLAATVWTA